MKKSNEITLKEAINEFLNTYKLKEKVNQMRLIEAWESIVGKTIARYTTSLVLKNKILYIELNSSALKHELTLAKGKIKQTLNAYFEEQLIEDIFIK